MTLSDGPWWLVVFDHLGWPLILVVSICCAAIDAARESANRRAKKLSMHAYRYIVFKHVFVCIYLFMYVYPFICDWKHICIHIHTTHTESDTHIYLCVYLIKFKYMCVFSDFASSLFTKTTRADQLIHLCRCCAKAPLHAWRKCSHLRATAKRRQKPQHNGNSKEQWTHGV